MPRLESHKMHKLRFADGVGIRLSLIAVLAMVAFGLYQSSDVSSPSTSSIVPLTDVSTVAFQDEETAPPETAADDSTAAPEDETVAETTDSETEAAAEEPEEEPNVVYAIDNVTMFICAVLVLFMQAGFALVEVGLNSPRNAVNILYKNLMDLCIGALLFYLIGYGLMYPGNYGEVLFAGADGYFSFGGFGIYGESQGTFSPQVDWFFQAAFAATAATIVSGAVAGRMKFSGYLVYSALLTAIIYPISGYWKWGGGWLQEMGFQDFAGSAVVHGVGGFAGLAGAMILGPRTGRFVNGKSHPMPAHNLILAALGVFILWVGWYGFNPGSQLSFSKASDMEAISLIAVNTTLAAAAGGFIATVLSWILYKKPDLSLSLNGVLGGLVGITACCDCFGNGMAIVIGGIAGALVIGGVVLLEKLQIDDPVGAWPVHGLCGVWGCMVIGIFPNSHTEANTTGFMTQLIGTVSIIGWAFVTMSLLFLALKACNLLRVSVEDEKLGLDVVEHGMHAYFDPDKS